MPNCAPIIIIGAPRSGTNMLRDTLTKLPNCATWPCDEINYIWKHYHKSYKTDAFPESFANEKTRKYILNKFQWVSNKYNCHFVVEKTCANSLRVEYLHKLLPDAKFVFIYRNGLDVIGSSMKRWKASLELSYLVKKARFVPITDLPLYAFKYMWNHTYRSISREKRLAVWGPKFEGLEKLKDSPLDEICAKQWKACVDASTKGAALIPSRHKTIVTYENFVASPKEELARIANDLGLEFNQNHIAFATSTVSKQSVNKGIHSLTKEQSQRLGNIIETTMQEHGY